MGSCRLTYTLKMRFLIIGVFVCLAAVAYARPQEETAVEASNVEVVAQEEPAVEVQEGRANPMKKAKKADKKDDKGKKGKKDDKKARKGNKKDNKGNKKNNNNQRRKKNNKNKKNKN